MRGQLTPGPDTPTTLTAVGMPLVAEAAGVEADGVEANDGTVVMAVGWPAL